MGCFEKLTRVLPGISKHLGRIDEYLGMSVITMDEINKAKLKFVDGRQLVLIPLHGGIEKGCTMDPATIA